MSPTNSGLSMEEAQLKEGLFDFIEKGVMPIQKSIENIFEDERLYWRGDGLLADEIVEARRKTRIASAEAGYYSMFCPEELGGGGLSCQLYFSTWEELCYHYGSPQTQLPFFVLAHTSTGPTALWSHASQSLKDELLPQLLRGEVQGTFAMSEPGAGSDAWMMTTHAERDGDEWVLNGQKQWASWAPTADFLITFAITDRELFRARKGGLTCFYVPTSTPGYKVDSLVGIFDEIGSEHCILSLTDARVPDRFRLGPEGEGFSVAMQGSDQLKLTKLGRCIGLTRWALERATEYSRVRQTFGKTLSEHQSVQNMLAESAAELYAAKLMAVDIATKIDQGQNVRGEAAMAHAWVFEAMYRIYDRVMQIFGGMGLTNDMKLINGWHHLRIARISEGPTEVQLRTVAKQLLRGAIVL